MKFLWSFLRRNLAEKPVATSQVPFSLVTTMNIKNGTLLSSRKWENYDRWGRCGMGFKTERTKAGGGSGGHSHSKF